MFQLCHVESETLSHFLLECRILETVRKPIRTEFKKVFSDVAAEYPDAARYTLVQLLLLRIKVWLPVLLCAVKTVEGDFRLCWMISPNVGQTHKENPNLEFFI